MRITSARDQVEMLAPWRTAAPVPGKRPRMTTDDVINQVREQTGINLEMANTGGNCNVLEGRLEDGSWIRAADHNDFCHWDLEDRHDDEGEHGPMGWDVSFHPNLVEDGEDQDTWDGQSTIHWHEDSDAHLHELPRVISDAFASMPPDAKQKHRESVEADLRQRGWKPGDQVWKDELGDHGGKDIPDYEDLVNPRDDLDDDYGDIFGKESMRRVAFNWKNEKWDGIAGEDFPEGYHRSKTENGHQLYVYRVRRPDGFAWSIYAPHQDSDNPATMTMVDGAGHRYGDEIPSVEHAKAAAEEAYKKLFPIGTDTGPRESGVDYSDLNKFMDMDAPQIDPDEHLDPDDPRIKGASRIAQMSYEDTMRHIDEQLAASEPEDTSDYSTDYYVDAPHEGLEDDPESRGLADAAYRERERENEVDQHFGHWLNSLPNTHMRWLEEMGEGANRVLTRDFQRYLDHKATGSPYTLTPLPDHEVLRQRGGR